MNAFTGWNGIFRIFPPPSRLKIYIPLTGGWRPNPHPTDQTFLIKSDQWSHLIKGFALRDAKDVSKSHSAFSKMNAFSLYNIFFARIGRTILPKNSKRSGRLSATILQNLRPAKASVRQRSIEDPGFRADFVVQHSSKKQRY